MVSRRPLFRLLLQRIRVTPDETPLRQPTHAMHRPRPTRERVKWCRRLRQTHLVDPRKGLRGFGVTKPDSERTVEEEGLHDAVIGCTVADPARSHLFHVELVPSVGRAMVVESPVEAFCDVAVTDEEEEVDSTELKTGVRS